MSHICRKAYTSINIIFRCFDTAHVPALIIAYKSFVRPILEYCSTVWNPYIPNRHYLRLTDQIERVQRYFTRRVYYQCKLDCSHDYLQRLKFLNLESLELRRLYNDLIMVYKIVHGLVNINAHELDSTRFNKIAIQGAPQIAADRGRVVKGVGHLDHV